MDDNTIKYKLKKGFRTRSISISIHSDSRVVVSAPTYVTKKTIEDFILKKSAWIKRSLAHYSKMEKLPSFELDKQKREEIKDFVTKRLEEINKTYNLKYNKVYIKNHKSRWGSCSSARNLNFNYRVFSLPSHLSEYIIVHELCHIKEMNHSKRFWDLVAIYIPDHKERRRELKKILF